MKMNMNQSSIFRYTPGIFILLFASVFFSSCDKDFLDVSPKTIVEEKDAFSTPGKILAQVNNLYARLQNQNLYGGRWIIFNEQRSDEFGQNDGNAATGSAVWNQNVATTNEYINDVWSAAYTAINAANILMSELEKTQVIPDSLAKLYIAEAKFVRGLSYLILVQTYAKPYNLNPDALGVPLRLIAIKSIGNNDLARSTVREVYAQIIKDLDEAEAGLPSRYATSALNSSRAHKSTAIALKTRVYLNTNNFVKLAEEARKIVTDQPPFQHQDGSLTHRLESNVQLIWGGSYTGSESIFTIPFANTNTETPSAQYSLAFTYLTQPILFLTEEGVGADSAFLNPQDGRSTLVSINAAKRKVLRKFTITTAPFRDYVPVIRYAEVLLNYAEAAAQNGQLPLAAELLKAVRNRSNPSYQFADDVLNDKDKLLDAIWKERRVEFVGEGLRLQDLQRRVLTLPSKKGSIGTAPSVAPDAKNYIWPIPSGELSTNKLCLPN